MHDLIEIETVENIVVLALIVLAAWGMHKLRDRLNEGGKDRFKFWRVIVLYPIVIGFLYLAILIYGKISKFLD